MREIIILLAKYTVIIPYLMLAYVWWRADKKNKKNIIIFSVCMIVLAFILGLLIAQHLYTNPRPPYKDGSVAYFTPSDYNGFPSDHALFAATAAFIVLKFRRTWGYYLLALAVFVGWMRVVVHVHHAVDIVGGLAIAWLSYFISVKLFPLFLRSPKSEKHTKM